MQKQRRTSGTKATKAREKARVALKRKRALRKPANRVKLFKEVRALKDKQGAIDDVL